MAVRQQHSPISSSYRRRSSSWLFEFTRRYGPSAAPPGGPGRAAAPGRPGCESSSLRLDTSRPPRALPPPLAGRGLDDEPRCLMESSSPPPPPRPRCPVAPGSPPWGRAPLPRPSSRPVRSWRADSTAAELWLWPFGFGGSWSRAGGGAPAVPLGPAAVASGCVLSCRCAARSPFAPRRFLLPLLRPGLPAASGCIPDLAALSVDIAKQAPTTPPVISRRGSAHVARSGVRKERNWV
jgi:hypothetical protein